MLVTIACSHEILFALVALVKRLLLLLPARVPLQMRLQIFDVFAAPRTFSEESVDVARVAVHDGLTACFEVTLGTFVFRAFVKMMGSDMSSHAPIGIQKFVAFGANELNPLPACFTGVYVNVVSHTLVSFHVGIAGRTIHFQDLAQICREMRIQCRYLIVIC